MPYMIFLRPSCGTKQMKIMVEYSTIMSIHLLYLRTMEKETKTYDSPYVGCLGGAAYQKMIIDLEATLKKYGLKITAAEYMILRALYSSDGLQQCEISQMIGKDKASISRSVSVLTKKGYVRQEQVSYKCCRVWLTQLAQSQKPLIMKIAAERHTALLVIASPTDIEAFVKVLKAIVND